MKSAWPRSRKDLVEFVLQRTPWRRIRLAVQLRRHSYEIDIKVHRSVRFEGSNARIGNVARIRANCVIWGPCKIGDDVFLNEGVFVEGGSVIGNGCAVGPFVRLLTSHHEFGPSAHRSGRLNVKPVSIGNGVWIGAGAIVLPGVRIGEGCVVGAGALVTTDCEPNGLYMGSPARRVRTLV